MKPLQLKNKKRLRRKQSIRARIRRDTTLPRLSVNRTLKHFTAQIIDDATGNTLCSVTSTGKAAGDLLGGKTKTERAKLLGSELGSKAKEKGIEKVAFDRGASTYHGRVKAFADAAREAGLKF
jgi:large subunit ribosomal protein L18